MLKRRLVALVVALLLALVIIPCCESPTQATPQTEITYLGNGTYQAKIYCANDPIYYSNSYDGWVGRTGTNYTAVWASSTGTVVESSVGAVGQLKAGAT